MKAIILAAGYATRLYPLTKNQPKPLLNIGEEVILEHIIQRLREIEDLDKIYIVTNQKFYSHFQGWLKNYPQKENIKVVNDGTKSDDDKLGAIGDFAFTLEKENINDDVVLVAGDNYYEFSLKPIHRTFKQKNKPTIALYKVANKEQAKSFAVVETDENNKIIDLKEKPAQPKSTLCSIALYFYPQETLKLVEKYLSQGNNPDAPGYLVEWLYQEEDVYGHIYDSSQHKWFDIGTHQALKEAHQYLSHGQKNNSQNY